MSDRNHDVNRLDLRSKLATGVFAVTAELGPPLNPDPTLIRSTATSLAAVVDAANVTDNQAATVKVSPLASAVLMMQQGLAPILQVTTRDRNIMAIQSDLLGAAILGVETVLALSGDPLSVGPYATLTNAVADRDSLGLIEVITQMNGGVLVAGERLDRPTDFFIGAAANPLVDRVDKLEQKVEAGAQFFQTNIVFDVERFSEWFAGVVAAGIPSRAPVIVGVTPPRSTRMLEHMHRHIPGVEVDDATFARLAGLEGEEAKDAGVEVAVDAIRALQKVAAVAGVHIMAPGWEAEAVPRVAIGANVAVTGR